ncbi:hypothetical protein FOZ76_03700 [Verticiella sediminum]|uniref:Uncharacterized protein n=1 Tax=Verticiella sediminum TaxID=1247510 RepID=A0A556AYD9_9BURK|nr:hypothetical protein [Verticiella sediminum]TSH97906.1 hypothetical protein FOZ76_03700 [Verticiella sediminum]
MRQNRQTWWLTGARWSAGALALVLFAAVLLPTLTRTSDEPLLAALASHVAYLYGAAVIMGVIGWVDSYFLYRRNREDRRV